MYGAVPAGLPVAIVPVSELAFREFAAFLCLEAQCSDRARFDAQNGSTGAYLVGNPQEVATKILRHSDALGGISRFTFQMDNAGLSHTQLMQSIELIGNHIAPRVNGET